MKNLSGQFKQNNSSIIADYDKVQPINSNSVINNKLPNTKMASSSTPKMGNYNEFSLNSNNHNQATTTNLAATSIPPNLVIDFENLKTSIERSKLSSSALNNSLSPETIAFFGRLFRDQNNNNNSSDSNNNNNERDNSSIENEKIALQLQLDVTREQLTATSEKCKDNMEDITSLRKIREKLEAEVQKEFNIRSSLEAERLKLLEAFSNLKVENQALRRNLQSQLSNEVDMMKDFNERGIDADNESSSNNAVPTQLSGVKTGIHLVGSGSKSKIPDLHRRHKSEQSHQSNGSGKDRITQEYITEDELAMMRAELKQLKATREQLLSNDDLAGGYWAWV